MHHSPSEIVRQLLIDLDLGSGQTAEGQPSGDWPVYDSTEPTKPDEAITINDIPGLDDGRVQYTGEQLGPRGILIRVRGKTKKTCYDKAHSLFLAISKSSQVGGQAYRVYVTVDGTRYMLHCFSRIDRVRNLGKENPTSTRQVYVISCVVTVVPCP